MQDFIFLIFSALTFRFGFFKVIATIIKSWCRELLFNVTNDR